jgi:hypothetical protein
MAGRIVAGMSLQESHTDDAGLSRNWPSVVGMYEPRDRRDGAAPFLLSWLAHREECRRAERRRFLPAGLPANGHNRLRKTGLQERKVDAAAEA